MNYSNPNMKSGDLIFDHGTTWLARLIEWWTGSPFSHCGVLMETPDGLIVVQSISPAGVYPMTIDQFFARFPVSACSWISTGAGATWNDAVQAQTMAMVGDPYSTVSELEVAFGLTPPSGQYICTTFAAKVLGYCGINIPLSGLTPGKLVSFFTSRGKILNPC